MTHPEDLCQTCRSTNPVWYTTKDLWNFVVGSPNGIICPECFCRLAEDKVDQVIWWEYGAEDKEKYQCMRVFERTQRWKVE